MNFSQAQKIIRNEVLNFWKPAPQNQHVEISWSDLFICSVLARAAHVLHT